MNTTLLPLLTDDFALLSYDIQSIQSSALAAHYQMQETSGTTLVDSISTNDGTYTSVQLKGVFGTLFDGSASYADVSNSVSGLSFSGAIGAIVVRARVLNPSVWTDGTGRYIARFIADGSNQIQLFKSATSNRLICRYIANGTTYDINITTDTAEYFTLVMNYADSNQAAPIVQVWFNGVLQTPATPVTAFTGNPAVTGVIGAGSAVPASVFSGWIDEVAIYTGVNLTTQEASSI